MNDSLGNRKHKRSKDSLPIIVDGKDGSSLNIGVGGALVILVDSVPVLEDVAVTIIIAKRRIKINGTCLRCEPFEENYKAAIFFDESSFSRSDLELLKAYLQEDSPNLGFLT